MFRQDMWPFTPISLTEILDRETLSVLVAGCRERLGRDLIIIDVDSTIAGPKQRVDSFRPKQYYQGFCELLRSPDSVEGGDDACKLCDLRIATTHLRAENPDHPRLYRCHMGLVDSACSIVVRERQLGVLIAGQFRPSSTEDFQMLKSNIGRLERGEYRTMQVLDEAVGLHLRPLADQLSRAPATFRTDIQREVQHITEIASAEYERKKTLWEQDLMERIRSVAAAGSVQTLDDVREMTQVLLALIQQFCRCDYALFYANTRENDTVLTPIGHAGVPTDLHDHLPHFNWRKAGFPLAPGKLTDWDIKPNDKVVARGLRGGKAEEFANTSCILPASLGELFRGVLVCGPFSEPVDLDLERGFLIEMTRIISRYILTELQKLSLLQQQKEWQSRAQLITHQVRTTMMSILTQVGTAQILVENSDPFASAKRIDDLLRGAEALGLRLGKATAETLNSQLLHLEREDFEFDSYPLSVLVANCAAGYARVAADRDRRLVVDESIEMLPIARVDIARFTIALSNIIENAIKYSFPKRTIYVRRGAIEDYARDTKRAFIEVEDLGHKISEEEQARIFEQGQRGVIGTTASMIGGSGLGLWEAQAVAQAHGGTIRFTTRPTRQYYKNSRGHIVNFIIEIPLGQNR